MASPSPTRRRLRAGGVFWPFWGSPVPEAQNGSQTGLQNGSKKGSKFGSKFGSKTRSKFRSKKVTKTGSKKWTKRGQKSGSNGVKFWVQKVSRNGSKKVVQTGSKKWSKRGQNLGPKSVPKWVKKSDSNGVKIWSKRGQILTPETDVQKLGSRNDIREHFRHKKGHQERKTTRYRYTSCIDSSLFVLSWCLLLACCARALETSRKNKQTETLRDRFGQMIVSNVNGQRTTTPLFKVIIRDS